MVKIMEVMSKKDEEDILKEINNLLKNVNDIEVKELIIKGIREPNLVTLDYSNIKSIFEESPRTNIIKGNQEELNNKLKKINLDGLNGVLVYILGDENIKITDYTDILNSLNLPKKTKLVFGASVRNFKNKERKVYVVLNFKK